ncbi:MAG TPA: DoxX family membrane protein [Egibacteraceae bacterium]|nr:DoxX family membrane protein [Egibacteraceae bacterium]
MRRRPGRAMRVVARLFAGPGMVALGVNHFANPDFYVAIIPRGLPAPEALNYLSGAAEIAGGVMTMIPRTRRLGGWLLLALLVAVFPANINMALHPEQFPQVPGGRAALLLRLPLQALFGYWVWLAALADHPDG